MVFFKTYTINSMVSTLVTNLVSLVDAILQRKRNVDLVGINMIEMPVRPTLGIMSTGHTMSES